MVIRKLLKCCFGGADPRLVVAAHDDPGFESRLSLRTPSHGNVLLWLGPSTPCLRPFDPLGKPSDLRGSCQT